MNPPDGVEMIPVDPENRKSDWLALRRLDVTASEVAALLGVDVHPYRTPRRLWEVKAGHVRERVKDTRQLLRGRLMEPIVRKLIAEDNPGWSVEAGQHYFRDPASRLGATPDAFIRRPDRPGFGNCQIKTAGQWAFRKNWIVDEDEPEVDEDGDRVRLIVPPAWIMAQSILEAHLTGADWACIAVVEMSDGLDLTLVDVPIDEAVVRNMHAKARKFWRQIESGEPPPFDWMRDADLIAQLYPSERHADMLDAQQGDHHSHAEVERAFDLYSEGARMIRDGQALKTSGASMLKARIGDGPGITLGRDARATWNLQSRARMGDRGGSISRVLRVVDKRAAAGAEIAAGADNDGPF